MSTLDMFGGDAAKPVSRKWHGGNMQTASPAGRSEIAQKIWAIRHAKRALIPMDQRAEFSPKDYTCSVCGVAFHGIRRKQEKYYCSKKCSGSVAGEKSRVFWRAVVGPPKPHGLNTRVRCVCKACGVAFKHAHRVFYCPEHQAAKWVARALAVKPKVTWLGWCHGCDQPFAIKERSFKRPRKYCSYDCFVASGGTIRAGTEATKMTRIYGTRKDANHKPIVDVLRKLGISYIDLSALGCGVPDLLVNIRGTMQLWEIKNRKTSYGKKGHNKIQTAWNQAWRGSQPVIIESIDAALAEINRP